MSKTDRDHTRKAWRSSLTYVEPNRILLRGYPLDEVMGRVSFAEAVYLLMVGELPSKTIGRLMEALLVSLIDHGTAPPSTQGSTVAAELSLRRLRSATHSATDTPVQRALTSAQAVLAELEAQVFCFTLVKQFKACAA